MHVQTQIFNDKTEKPECDAAAERVVNALIQHGLHITFAESCTGGLAAARVVDVPNASCVLDASFVTYANWAKEKFMHVAEEDIAKHGVVSECVALSMAKGAAAAANADIGVGISGIAGPAGGSAEKPVGTVCFGFYFGGKAGCGVPQFEISKTMHFGAIGRQAVRNASVDFVFEMLEEFFKAK